MAPSPNQAHERVAFGTPAEWITSTEVDDSYRAPEEAALVVLLRESQHHATRQEAYHRTVLRLETIAGVQQAAQWRCDFDPATQWVTIHALVVRRDQTIRDHADPERLRILQREENLERYTLDGHVSLVILLEDVRVGDVIDMSFTLRTRPRIFASQFALLTAIPVGAYTRMFRLSVRFPAGHPMSWKTDSTMIALNERSANDDETEWSWKVEDFAPREPEPGMPTWYFQGRFIQVTDFASWEAVVAGFLAAWEEDFTAAGLHGCANEIAALPSLEQRVERALQLVQDELRYLSVNTELGGQIPTPPVTVLRRRFGDCKDKAFLLVHLLRQLGVSARPVLVNAHLKGHIEKFLPTPAAFDHAIVEYELGGQRHWVDATIPLQGGGPLGRTLPDFGRGLPLGPGVTGLEPIHPVTETAGSYELQETFHLDSSEAPLVLHAITTATGLYADALRRQLVFEGNGATAKSREQNYQRLYPQTNRLRPLEWTDDRDRNRLLLAEAFEIPDAIVRTDEAGIGGFHLRAHLMQSLLAFQESERRSHPLAMPFPARAKQTIALEFETLFPSRGGHESVATEAFFCEFKAKRAVHSSVFNFDFETYSDHVTPEHYADHRGSIRQIWPMTDLGIYVSIGRRVGRGRRDTESLLPATPDPKAPETLTTAATSAETTPGIAPRLSSLPAAEQKPVRSMENRRPQRSSSHSRKPSPASRLPRSSGSASQSNGTRSMAMFGSFILILVVKVIALILAHLN